MHRDSRPRTPAADTSPPASPEEAGSWTGAAAVWTGVLPFLPEEKAPLSQEAPPGPRDAPHAVRSLEEEPRRELQQGREDVEDRAREGRPLWQLEPPLRQGVRGGETVRVGCRDARHLDAHHPRVERLVLDQEKLTLRAERVGPPKEAKRAAAAPVPRGAAAAGRQTAYPPRPRRPFPACPDRPQAPGGRRRRGSGGPALEESGAPVLTPAPRPPPLPVGPFSLRGFSSTVADSRTEPEARRASRCDFSTIFNPLPDLPTFLSSFSRSSPPQTSSISYPRALLSFTSLLPPRSPPRIYVLLFLYAFPPTSFFPP